MSLNEIQNTSGPNDGIEKSDQIEESFSDLDEDHIQEESQLKSTPHADIRDKVERKKVRRRLFGVGMIWVTTLALLTFVAAMAWLFRAQIVEKFPNMRALYAAVGIEASETGLVIQEIRTEFGYVDGTPVLFINGEIKNYDLQSRDVPLVQINFKNDNGEILANWVIEAPKSVLEKGESQDFSGQYPTPPIDATKLVPTFVDETVGTTILPEPQ